MSARPGDLAGARHDGRRRRRPRRARPRPPHRRGGARRRRPRLQPASAPTPSSPPQGRGRCARPRRARCLLEAIEVALRAPGATGGLVDPTVGAALTLAGPTERRRADRSGPAAAARRAGCRAGGRSRSTARPRRPRCRAASASTSARPRRRSPPTAPPRAIAAPAAPACSSASAATWPPPAPRPPAAGPCASPTTTRAAERRRSASRLARGALATSSTTVRRWRGRRRRTSSTRATGAGAAGRLAHRVSVAAATCVDANAASTAAIVLGAAAPAWLAARGAPRPAGRSGRRDACTSARLAGGSARPHDRSRPAPPALWYLTRGTGAVTLVLLTASVVLGIAEVRALAPAPGAPRFMVAALHRTVSLLVRRAARRPRR